MFTSLSYALLNTVLLSHHENVYHHDECVHHDACVVFRGNSQQYNGVENRLYQ